MTSTTHDPTVQPDHADDAVDEPIEATQELIEEIRADAAQEAGVSAENQYGEIGRPFDRRAPFVVGFLAALGVACAAAIAWTVVAAGQILILLGLAFFIALGLEPAVVWLYGRGAPRWLAVSAVLLASVGLFVGFLLVAVPVVVSQATHLSNRIPGYLHSAHNPHTELGKLNAKYHVITSLQNLLHGKSSFNTALGVGRAALDFAASVVLVGVVAVYLLIDLPRIRRGLYELAPRTRRARMVLLSDEIFSRVGGYVFGNVLTSLIAGLGTWVWAMAFGIPYALLLGMLVALLDLIPMIGSTIGGIIVSLVALTVSPAIAIATAIFYFLYRFLEDYLVTPRIMARTVSVPGLLIVVATVIGGALLGIIGALVAIPVAAAIKLLLDELLVPRLDER
jgi:predicted PurR-regulated permease PerM